jgi:hypothetical protein
LTHPPALSVTIEVGLASITLQADGTVEISGPTTTKMCVARPRVRSRDGVEVPIPFIEELRNSDPKSERVIEQMLLGVSTRGYAQSLDPMPDVLPVRGASKSSASSTAARVFAPLSMTCSAMSPSYR